VRDLVDACRDADVVLLCVKPKDVPEVLAALREGDALAHAPLLVSIAAGVTIASLESGTGGRVPVVRAMPNTASQIGRGCTVVSRGELATDEHMNVATAIFTGVGRCMALDERTSTR
jgi:pyrroline-5-carboxylate reductase